MPQRDTTIDATLAEVFGYREFRPHQREIVASAYKLGDRLAWRRVATPRPGVEHPTNRLTLTS
jgi:hypothetical protein